MLKKGQIKKRKTLGLSQIWTFENFFIYFKYFWEHFVAKANLDF
jgi:hypothetical protein